MTDKMQQDKTEGVGAASALSDGLGVALPPDCKFYFSNGELAAAIAYAFQCCDQKYVGGYGTSTTEPGKAMLEHLKALLTAQKIRVGMIETPNARNNRLPEGSPVD